MQAGPPDPARDLAQARLDNALALFEEFVRATARHADAATLRGLERRFAERVQIQPSYWSQIKGRSRQIGERLARQFEHLCHKPPGWMDVPRLAGAATGAGAGAGADSPTATSTLTALLAEAPRGESQPRDDDERFIVGLVLSYYRRHPQRARTRLLDLLGEVLTPQPEAPSNRSTAPTASTASTASPAPLASPAPPASPRPARSAPMRPGAQAAPGGTTGSPRPMTPLTQAAEDAQALWLHTQAGVAPLKRRK